MNKKPSVFSNRTTKTGTPIAVMMLKYKKLPIFDFQYGISCIGITFSGGSIDWGPKIALLGPPPASAPPFEGRFSFNFLIESSLKMVPKSGGRDS